MTIKIPEALAVAPDLDEQVLWTGRPRPGNPPTVPLIGILGALSMMVQRGSKALQNAATFRIPWLAGLAILVERHRMTIARHPRERRPHLPDVCHTLARRMPDRVVSP